MEEKDKFGFEETVEQPITEIMEAAEEKALVDTPSVAAHAAAEATGEASGLGAPKKTEGKEVKKRGYEDFVQNIMKDSPLIGILVMLFFPQSIYDGMTQKEVDEKVKEITAEDGKVKSIDLGDGFGTQLQVTSDNKMQMVLKHTDPKTGNDKVTVYDLTPLEVAQMQDYLFSPVSHTEEEIQKFKSDLIKDVENFCGIDRPETLSQQLTSEIATAQTVQAQINQGHESVTIEEVHEIIDAEVAEILLNPEAKAEEQKQSEGEKESRINPSEHKEATESQQNKTTISFDIAKASDNYDKTESETISVDVANDQGQGHGR